MEDSSQAGQITLNNKFVLKYPDGFHVMSEEERSKLALLGEGQWVGLSDPERHMIVCAGWREVSKYALMLLGGKDLSRNMEKQIRKAMMPYGYKLGGLKELQIAGTQANGFSYEYTVQDVAMYAESYVLKSKNTVYYFHLYARAALRDESLPVWEEMLESVGTV